MKSDILNIVNQAISKKTTLITIYKSKKLKKEVLIKKSFK